MLTVDAAELVIADLLRDQGPQSPPEIEYQLEKRGRQVDVQEALSYMERDGLVSVSSTNVVALTGKAKADSNGDGKPEKVCEHCGDIFVPLRSDSRACSPACKEELKRAEDRERSKKRHEAKGSPKRAFKDRICERCNKGFSPTGTRQKFCDDCKAGPAKRSSIEKAKSEEKPMPDAPPEPVMSDVPIIPLQHPLGPARIIPPIPAAERYLHLLISMAERHHDDGGKPPPELLERIEARLP